MPAMTLSSNRAATLLAAVGGYVTPWASSRCSACSPPM
jgi:hypothetical protein